MHLQKHFKRAGWVTVCRILLAAVFGRCTFCIFVSVIWLLSALVHSFLVTLASLSALRFKLFLVTVFLALLQLPHDRVHVLNHILCGFPLPVVLFQCSHIECSVAYSISDPSSSEVCRSCTAEGLHCVVESSSSAYEGRPEGQQGEQYAVNSLWEDSCSSPAGTRLSFCSPSPGVGIPGYAFSQRLCLLLLLLGLPIASLFRGC